MGEPSIHAGRLTLEDNLPWLGLQPSPQRRVEGKVILQAVREGDQESYIYFVIDYLKPGQQSTIILATDERLFEKLVLSWTNHHDNDVYIRLVAGYDGPGDQLDETLAAESYNYHLSAVSATSDGVGNGAALADLPNARLTIETGKPAGKIYYRPHSSGGHALHGQEDGAVQAPANPGDWTVASPHWANGMGILDTQNGLQTGMYIVARPKDQATPIVYTPRYEGPY